MTPIRTDVPLQQSQAAPQASQQATDPNQLQESAALFTNLITQSQTAGSSTSDVAVAQVVANLAANQGLAQSLNASSTILDNLASATTTQGGTAMNNITNKGAS
ncbi:MAG: hypothetical protein B7X06_01805, partial [Verrucomicrobia bacterium 21-51-4]